MGDSMKQQEKIAEKQAKSERRASQQNQQFIGEEQSKEAALLRGSMVMSRLKEICYVRQRYSKLGLTEAEFDKFWQISADEQEWKSLLLASVIDDELILYPDDLTAEELREFMFMPREEGTQWREKLAKRETPQLQDRSSTSENPEEASKGRTDLQEKVKQHSVGIDRQSKVQMEVLMRPEVRPKIIALGVAHGMAGQKYIEHLIVDAINNNPVLVSKGEQYIKRAKGSIRRAIAIAQEDGATLSQDSLTRPIVTTRRR